MTLDQLSLEIDPTPAMLDGTQTVWQCTWCGCVVVLTSLALSKKPQTCPAGHDHADWSRQTLPVAGLRRATVVVDREDLAVVVGLAMTWAKQQTWPIEDYEGAAIRSIEDAMEETS